jgi:uncharacterized protein (DUF2062 family)
MYVQIENHKKNSLNQSLVNVNREVNTKNPQNNEVLYICRGRIILTKQEVRRYNSSYSREQSMNLKRQLKYFYLRFVRIRAHPKDIARGMAMGILLGMTPTFGFQMPLAVFLAALLKENKVASVLGVWITNPVSAPFVYAINYEIGLLILGRSNEMPKTFEFQELIKASMDIFLPLWIGGLAAGIVVAAIGYFVTLKLVLLYRKEKNIIISKLKHQEKSES